MSLQPPCPSLSRLLQFLWLWRARLLACERLEVCVCVDVFVLEAWGDRGQRSHADFNSGSVCVCVWRQGENRGTRLYNGARAQPASRSFHLSAAAPRHARTHYFSWPTDLTRPAVICHLAAIWPVSAGLLSARGSMVIPPFEGRPIQSHGWHCQNGLHYCDLYSAPANLSSTSTGEKVKKGGKLAMSSTSLLVLLSAVSLHPIVWIFFPHKNNVPHNIRCLVSWCFVF